MRPSRTDLVPMLTLIAGGALGGVLLTSSFLTLLSPSATAELAPDRLEEAPQRFRIERFSTLAAQTGSVTGLVTDGQTGSVLLVAQVYIAGLRLGALSQANGQYVIQNVPAGTHTLTVVHIGYRTTEVQITVGGGQTLDQNLALPPNGAIVQGRMPAAMRSPGRFIEAMEELERLAGPPQPVEVRAIRQR